MEKLDSEICLNTSSVRHNTCSSLNMANLIILLLTLGGLNFGYAASCESILGHGKNYTELVREDQLGSDFSNIADPIQPYTLTGYPNSVVRFSRPDSWGVPREFQNRGIELTVSVADKTEGVKLLKDLFGDQFNLSEIELPDRMGASIGNGIYASFQTNQESAGGIQTSMSLQLSNRERSSLEPDTLMVKALIDQGLIQANRETMQFDMSNNTGRHEWAVNSFNGNRSLTADEIQALNFLSGSAYRVINENLRKGQKTLDTVDLIDSALSKSTVNSEVFLYRSVEREDLNQVWSQLVENPSSVQNITNDPAYLYTSLDPEVAKWWQAYDKRDSGVILKIRTPAGANAVYIDSRIIERRGYLEMVLPRNSSFTATKAYTDEDGYKVLELNLEIE